jgi:hypothetical protein
MTSSVSCTANANSEASFQWQTVLCFQLSTHTRTEQTKDDEIDDDTMSDHGDKDDDELFLDIEEVIHNDYPDDGANAVDLEYIIPHPFVRAESCDDCGESPCECTDRYEKNHLYKCTLCNREGNGDGRVMGKPSLQLRLLFGALIAFHFHHFGNTTVLQYNGSIYHREQWEWSCRVPSGRRRAGRRQEAQVDETVAQCHLIEPSHLERMERARGLREHLKNMFWNCMDVYNEPRLKRLKREDGLALPDPILAAAFRGIVNQSWQCPKTGLYGINKAVCLMEEYENMERVSLLHLAVWKAKCLSQMPAVIHTLASALEWMTKGWKDHKAEQRKSGTMRTIVSLTLPYL